MDHHSYVFETTQQDVERERLEALQEVFDPTTQRHLDHLGITSGWCCLEVGPGAGSIMEWMCDRVGSQGHVVALDINPRFIASIDRPNLTICQQDITTTDLEADQFDVVHARTVLMHIPERHLAFAQMVRVLKPGGWLLVEEPDFLNVMALSQDGEVAEMANRIFDATRELYVAMNVDPYLGRKLPAFLQRLPLQAIDTGVNLDFLRGGSQRAKIWRMAVEHLQSALQATGILASQDIEHFLPLMSDPQAWMLDYAMISAWGQKPFRNL